MSPARNNAKSVAVVCDRRSRDDRGSHRQSLQEDQSVVAAVYDRRVENDFGAHRDAATGEPPQCSRKRQNAP